MGLPRVGVGKTTKGSRRENQSHREYERFVHRNARKKTLKHLLEETLLLFSYWSLLCIENARDLSPERRKVRNSETMPVPDK